MKVYPSPGVGEEITAEDRFLFTCGQCHRLAEVLNDVTGWPICAFWDKEYYDDRGDFSIHAFVQTPARKYLDITGLHTATEMKQEWGEYEIRKVTDFWPLEDWAPYMDDERIPRAWEIAPLVLAHHYKRIPTRIVERINEGRNDH